MPKERTSLVWRFFTCLNGETHATCNLCGRRIKPSGGTSNLKGHLQGLHKREFEAAQTRAQEEAVDEPMAAAHSRDHCELVKMVAKDLQPFQLVENEGFKNFVQYLKPNFSMPSRKCLSKTLVPAFYEEVKGKLQQRVDAARYPACTTDMWTSRTNTPYVTVTAHFIEGKQLRSAVLSSKPLPGLHRAEDIAGALEEILREWRCRDKVEAFTTDNAKNEVGAITRLGKRHVGCVAHTINLVVQDAIQKVPEVEQTLQQCRSIVTYFRASNIATNMLNEIQELLNRPVLALIKAVLCTRWFSDLHMARRILEISEALTMAQYRLAANDVRTRSTCPQPLLATQTQVLEEVVLALGPFEMATTDLSGDIYPTASLIVPEVMGLHVKLQEVQSRVITVGGRSFVDELMKGISERLLKYEASVIGRGSTFLDPRFKKHGFRVEANYDAAKKQVEAELRQLLGEEAPGVAEPADVPLADPGCSGLLDVVKRRVQDSRRNANPSSEALIAVDRYIKRPNKALKEDVVGYWMDRPVDGEQLAHLAERYLVVPATSVPSERVFSTAGQVIADRRCRLKPEKAAMLIFLKGNKWLY